jgi:ADP-heptose:LPS heptosyltransferase
MNYLGDALMTTPVHAALRRTYPTAQIDVIAGNGSAYAAASILELDPNVDSVIPRVHGGAWTRCHQLYTLIRAGSYDVVVVLPPIQVYQFTALAAGARVVVAMPARSTDRHMTDQMMDAVASIIPGHSFDRTLTLAVGEHDRQRSREIVGAERLAQPLTGLNLGASRPQKRWPDERFIGLAQELLQSKSSVLLLGGHADEENAKQIVAAVNDSRVLNLVGKTSIRELVSIIDICSAVVTADTAAMHIATAVGTDVVALFGSTDPQLTGPYGTKRCQVLYHNLECAPCGNHPTCNGAFTCMRSISVEEVVVALNALKFSASKSVKALAAESAVQLTGM